LPPKNTLRPHFIRKKILFVLCSFLLTTGMLMAQDDEISTAEILENYFRDNEQPGEADAQLLLELLENLRQNPLDLNKATPNELTDLRLLNQLQIEHFFNYRNKLGPFLNEYELQAIPEWSLADIRRVLHFAKIGQTINARNTPITKGLVIGDNELLLRWGRPVQPVYPDNAEGGPNAWAMRFRHTFDNRLRYGFTFENDPGEALFRGSNRNGTDFVSAHLFIQNWNERIKALALGDYSARFGQGLLLQMGFAQGKSAETTAIMRGGRKINGYGAFGEVFFLRGAATTIALHKSWELTALYSLRKRDANLVEPDTIDREDPELQFSALQSSGLHRTPAEIADEKSIREQTVGASLAYTRTRGHLSLNALRIDFDRDWLPTPAPYRKFTFQGREQTGLSLDYQWRKRNLLLFGEGARSANGGTAFVNGLLLGADQHVTFSALHRRYARDYQSLYALPFAETTGAANEQGLYLGADIRWLRRWQINLYADVWQHPWLRFGVSGPSRGHEYLARVQWSKGRNFSVYGLWQSETKQRDASEQIGLVNNRRERLRLHTSYKVLPGVELRSRVEWMGFVEGRLPRTRGFLLFQEASFKPLGSNISGAVRYAMFDTDNFDTRVFAFENDLFSAVSIPSFSGRGSRYYLNLQWRINRNLRLEGRVEQTNLVQAVTTTAQTGRETVWKLQARVKF
jgi:hypothetical protein